MGEVDEENKSEDDEKGGAEHGDVVAPKHEESVRDEEGNGDEGKP